MSGESLLALAVCHAPQFDGVVLRPSDKLHRIRRVELDAKDARAAIFSNVSFTGNFVVVYYCRAYYKAVRVGAGG
jgi:hypothetical protein